MKKLTLLLWGISSLTFAVPCTDFSGKWEGTCFNSLDGSTKDDVTTISQTGCEKIDVDGRVFEFGKELSFTEAYENFDAKHAMLLDWNADKTVFDGRYSTVATLKSGSPYYTASGTFVAELESGKLSVDHEATLTPQGGQTYDFTVSCSYSN